MSLLLAIAIGTGLGIGVGFLFHRNLDYFFIDLLVGVTGAILGMAVEFLANVGQGFGLVSVRGVVSSIIGAGALLLVYQLVLQLPKKKHKTVHHPQD